VQDEFLTIIKGFSPIIFVDVSGVTVNKVLTEGIVIVSEEIEDLIGNKVVGVL